MHGGIARYVEQRIDPGDFLYAVLTNDLAEAAGRADETNIRLLHVYAAFFCNEVPRNCHGSKKAVYTWLQESTEAA